jgi:hypothetical protein
MSRIIHPEAERKDMQRSSVVELSVRQQYTFVGVLVLMVLVMVGLWIGSRGRFFPDANAPVATEGDPAIAELRRLLEAGQGAVGVAREQAAQLRPSAGLTSDETTPEPVLPTLTPEQKADLVRLLQEKETSPVTP